MPRRQEESNSIYNTQFSCTKKQANEFGTLFINMKMDFGVTRINQAIGTPIQREETGSLSWIRNMLY
jgi:hypothetical protein